MGGLKYSWATESGTRHQVGYTGVWRQITGLAANASPTVRHDAGDTVKSSISHTWLSDQRNDRFQLGGPTDVRGFKISGLGPRDGPDAVGGDIYAAGSANLLVPFPRVGKDSPLRMQIFANAGRLLALRDSGDHGSKSTQKRVYGTAAQLFDGAPSLAAGVGVVYAHPVARFEMNFSLPLILRRGEEGRKGLQFGVGINFL